MRSRRFIVRAGVAGAAALIALSAEVAPSDAAVSAAPLTWTSLSAGAGHTCAIRSDGTAWCWGYNVFGQLGDGTTDNSSVPVQVGDKSDWVQISAGTSHSCGIRKMDADRSAWCWGANFAGQLGNGSTVSSSVPVRVGRERTATAQPAIGNWLSVYAAGSHTCGLRGPGDAWCWGNGSFGKLGNGHRGRFYRVVPVPVRGGNHYLSLHTGFQHTCAIRDDHTAWCWGSNFYGQLGIGTHGRKSSKDVPVQVGSASDWASIDGGGGSTCGIRESGTLWCWGLNHQGELGIGNTKSKYSPKQVGTATSWAEVVPGGEHTCATRTDGTGWCWGDNDNGQVGDGTTTTRLRPVQVGSQNDWSLVAAGGFHSCGILGGTTYCWGMNAFGQLGDGTTKDRHVPTKIKSGKVLAG